MLRTPLLQLAILLLLATGVPGTSAAFTCETFDDSNCIRWFEGQVTIKSFLGRPSGGLINGTTTWDQNTFMAANDWNSVAGGLRYNVTTDGPFRDPCTTPGPCAGTGAAGENPVYFTNSVCGGGNFGSDVIAQTVTCFRLDNGAIVNAPVFFNQNIRWNAYDGNLINGTTDIRRVILHELGHVGGLGHPDDAGQNVVAIMNRRVSVIDRPQADDVNGMRFVYGGGNPPPGVATSGGGCSLTPRQGSPVQSLALMLVSMLLLWRRRAAGVREAGI